MSNGLINRQYVGARYVPKIMGEWNKALQYEALSVVTYMGNSFTSKIPVPSNIDITNTTYWVNTANYNAQVEQYRKDTANYKAQVEQYRTDTVNYKKDIEELYKNKLYTNMKDKKALVIGDSWGVGYNGTPDQSSYHGWCELILPHFKSGSIKKCMGGYSFNLTNYSYITLLNSVTDTDIDIIIAIGGANETHTNDVSAFVKTAKNKYPKAEIYIGINTPVYNGIDALVREKSFLNEAIINGAKPIYNLINVISTFYNLFTTDKYHLKDYSKFTEAILSGIYTNYATIKEPYIGAAGITKNDNAFSNAYQLTLNVLKASDKNTIFTIGGTLNSFNMEVEADKFYTIATITNLPLLFFKPVTYATRSKMIECYYNSEFAIGFVQNGYNVDLAIHAFVNTTISSDKVEKTIYSVNTIRDINPIINTDIDTGNSLYGRV